MHVYVIHYLCVRIELLALFEMRLIVILGIRLVVLEFPRVIFCYFGKCWWWVRFFFLPLWVQLLATMVLVFFKIFL